MNPVARILESGNVVLAPMAGITEAPFRAICKQLGAGLTYTEMVSATGLHYNPDSPAAQAILAMDPAEVPCAVQLFGANPEIMAAQAARIVERYGEDVALIDVNMGCPVPKVVNRGEGCGMMRTPDVAASVVAAIVEAVDVPVTVKFRAGWDADSINAPEFARAMQDAGASAVAVHGRTRSQHYRGHADRAVIAAVKAAVDVPVIGSGDVFSAQDVADMLAETGCDGVMVARGSQGNPWIFREARALIDRGEVLDPPTYVERIEMARRHASELVRLTGPRAVVRMRKHVAWYCAGMPGASHVRGRVNECKLPEELDALLVEYRDHLVSL